ncbi:hypothetical protein MMPV_000507 [Pyropia vietnamensis]
MATAVAAVKEWLLSAMVAAQLGVRAAVRRRTTGAARESWAAAAAAEEEDSDDRDQEGDEWGALLPTPTTGNVHARGRRAGAAGRGPVGGGTIVARADGGAAGDDLDRGSDAGGAAKRRRPRSHCVRRGGGPWGLPDGVVAAALGALALAVRLWRLRSPPEIVFDEVHFVRFVWSNYWAGRYLFDIHPPLGKLILLAVAKAIGAEPRLPQTPLNGMAYGAQVYAPLRATSAAFGAGTPPLTYALCRELGLSWVAALLPGLAGALDHLVIVESRLILLDAQLHFFIVAALYLAVRLWKARRRTAARLRWLVATAAAGAAAVGVKFTAVATPLLIAGVSLVGGPTGATTRLEVWEMAVAGAVAGALYVSLFVVHFWLLPGTGDGDGFMLMPFQATLKGSPHFKEGAPRPSFWRSFLWLNGEMYRANARITATHGWQSPWYTWPASVRGIYYHGGFDTATGYNTQVYLISNPAVVAVTLLALVAFPLWMAAWYAPRVIRGVLLPASRVHHTAALGGLCLAGYALNLLPYVLVTRCTFLYHYIPAGWWAQMLVAVAVDGLPLRPRRAAVGVSAVAIGVAFLYWAPWIYATPLSSAAHARRRWLRWS